MGVEKPEYQPGEKDLTNEDVVTQILESGSDEELERLREFHNLTPEQIELFRAFIRLRKKTREQMQQELKKRIKENPVATEEELGMGIYQESVEPQVREAVLNLRRKGYTTYESGFSGFNGQKISFEKNHLVPEELIDRLKIEGINIKIKPNSISFSCDQYLELDEIKKIWDQIEQSLPELGKPAEPCNLPLAKFFRERQKDLE